MRSASIHGPTDADNPRRRRGFLQPRRGGAAGFTTAADRRCRHRVLGLPRTRQGAGPGRFPGLGWPRAAQRHVPDPARPRRAAVANAGRRPSSLPEARSSDTPIAPSLIRSRIHEHRNPPQTRRLPAAARIRRLMRGCPPRRSNRS